MTGKMTVEEKNARLTEIAESVSDEVIRSADKRQLEIWCKGLFPISKLRKNELAEKLIEFLTPIRKDLKESVETELEKPDTLDRRHMQRLELGEFPDTSIDTEARLIFDELVNVANTVGDDYIQRMNRLAAIFARHNQRENLLFAPLTRRARVTDLKKLLTKLAYEYGDETLRPILSSLKDSFIGLISAGMSMIHKQYRQDYEKKVSEKHRTAQENVDGKFLLEFAFNALTLCEDWRDVSIALIITTGRRMSEIHGYSTNFEIVDENTLLFEGQMKTKGRVNVYAYEIPTLVPVSLVMSGIEYLNLNGRIYEETEDLDLHEIVNKKVSMALSRQVKKHFPKRIYYDFRAIYAELCWIKWGVHGSMTKTGYFSTILGHDDRSVSTALSYQKFRVSLNTTETQSDMSEFIDGEVI